MVDLTCPIIVFFDLKNPIELRLLAALIWFDDRLPRLLLLPAVIPCTFGFLFLEVHGAPSLA